MERFQKIIRVGWVLINGSFSHLNSKCWVVLFPLVIQCTSYANCLARALSLLSCFLPTDSLVTGQENN